MRLLVPILIALVASSSPLLAQQNRVVRWFYTLGESADSVAMPDSAFTLAVGKPWRCRVSAFIPGDTPLSGRAVTCDAGTARVVVKAICQWEHPSAFTDVWLAKTEPGPATYIAISCHSPWQSE